MPSTVPPKEERKETKDGRRILESGGSSWWITSVFWKNRLRMRGAEVGKGYPDHILFAFLEHLTSIACLRLEMFPFLGICKLTHISPPPFHKHWCLLGPESVLGSGDTIETKTALTSALLEFMA